MGMGAHSMSISDPGSVISIVPDHMQEHFESDVNAFCPAISAPAAPGDQGAVTTGMHGIGVSTPIAAKVAAATCGFAWVLHIPKGAMLSMGMLSITVAAGTTPPLAMLVGNTVSVVGARPSLHLSLAPVTTSLGMQRGGYSSRAEVARDFGTRRIGGERRQRSQAHYPAGGGGPSAPVDGATDPATMTGALMATDGQPLYRARNVRALVRRCCLTTAPT